MIATLARGRLHYAWLVVAATFVTLLVAAGIRSMPGLLILPLEAEFGWDRATISSAVSINLLLFGLCGPFAAAVVERVGMRRLMAGALLMIGFALALTTQMRAAWQLLLLWGLLAGIGVGALAGWVAATVSNRWFIERRGMVVGALSTTGATGQLIFLPMLASLIQTQGWRMAVLLVAGVAFLVVPLVLFLIRDHPQDVGLGPYGAPPGAVLAARPQPAAGNPIGNAFDALGRGLRNRDFLLLSGSFFTCGASANGLIGTHLVPASVEHGMTEVAAAGILAAMGAFNILGAMSSGWLTDRYDARRLLAWYYGLRGLSLLFLPFAFDAGVYAMALFVVFYGLDWSATVPPTVRLTSDVFGKRNAGTYYAWIFATHQLGAAMIAIVAGAMRLWFGDYHLSFMFSGTLNLIAVLMVSQIRRPAPSKPSLVGRPA